MVSFKRPAPLSGRKTEGGADSLGGVLFRDHVAGEIKRGANDSVGGMGLGIIRRDQKQVGSYLTAMASISHSTFLGRAFTATQLRAGLDVKYFA